MKLILVSHEGVASGIKKSVDMITGDVENIEIVELTEKNGVTGFTEQLASKMKKLSESNSEYIIIADLKGGTPFNQSMLAIYENDLVNIVNLISGLNLPLVLEALFTPEIDASNIVELGKNSIELTIIDDNDDGNNENE